MDKIVIIINGKGGVGKDTLCNFIIDKYHAEKISSITPILKIARENGWNGIKNKKSRKFLSDLKRAFTEFNDLPNKYLSSELDRFLKNSNNILFVHIREKVQIEKFFNLVKKNCICCTLLIYNEKDNSISYGNESDDFVYDYKYDYLYRNVGSLEETKKEFLIFFRKILDDKKLNIHDTVV